MKTRELLKKLEDYPLFTENDLSKMLKKPPEYIRTLACRLKKQNLIFRIEKGKYSVYSDPLAFSTFISVPSYASLWTALRFYDFTEQLPKDIFVMVPISKKEIKFNKVKIVFVKTKHFWGYNKERYGSFYIFMADKEKAVVDSLLSNKIPVDEIAKAIESKELDVDKLVDYAVRVNSSALSKRLGFLLEHFNLECGSLLKMVDYNYIPLDSMLKAVGNKSKKWKIIINRREFL